MRSFTILLLFLLSHNIFAQKENYASSTISDSLKINANSVVRNQKIAISVISQRKMSIKTLRVVTIFNEHGLEAAGTVENYNKATILKNIDAVILDSNGKEIKKFKQKDFIDITAAGGSTMFSDSRYIYLDYTPTAYPFTVVYSSELETSTTAFIPQWFPIDNYNMSVEKSSVNVTYPIDLGFRKMEFNFEKYPVEKTGDSAGELSYLMTNIPALKSESLSPSALSVFPRVMMSLSKFHLEGVDGAATTWQEFGKWYSEKILEGTTELSKESSDAIKRLVGSEQDPIQKARMVYDFVQQKSRYVSIQVGIGGWKPMFAKDVDRLGYGDCKALSNYTRALLKEVGVESYVTLLYGSTDKRNFQTDFVSMQGNHMILAIPDNDRYLWLECTSQDDAFGYQGIFTDDRDVLVVKPNGGEIVRTQIYPDAASTQLSKGNFEITSTGALIGKVSIESKGSQYARKVRIEKFTPIEKEKFYKDYWSNISNLKLLDIKFENDKNAIVVREAVQLSAQDYAKSSGNSLIFSVNVFNTYHANVARVRGRKMPFEIDRGFVDHDEVTIKIPQDYKIESIPVRVEINSKFGSYSFEIEKIDSTTFIYKRIFSTNRGFYSKEEYDTYRKFIDDVSRNDNAKMILTK